MIFMKEGKTELDPSLTLQGQHDTDSPPPRKDFWGGKVQPLLLEIKQASTKQNS